MGKNFRDTLNEQLKDPVFRAEWEALEPGRQITLEIIKGRPGQCALGGLAVLFKCPC